MPQRFLRHIRVVYYTVYIIVVVIVLIFGGKKVDNKKGKRGAKSEEEKNEKEPGRNSAFHRYDSNGPQFAPLLDPDSSPKKGEA